MARVSLVLLVLVMLLSVASPLLADHPLPLDRAHPPELEAAAFLNPAEPVRLADEKGKRAVLVVFFATWNEASERAVRLLNAIHEDLRNRGLVVIALSSEEKRTVEEFMRKKGVTYRVGAGSPSDAAYGATLLPRAFLVGTEGKVLWDGHPLDPTLLDALNDAIAPASPPRSS